MAFTSTDRRLLNGLKEAMTNLIGWKSGVDKDITSINSRVIAAQSSVSSASSLAKSATSTAIAAGQSASTARLGAQSATTAAATARDTATTAKDTAIEVSNSLSATMKLVDEVAAKVNEGPPGMITAVKNLQDDMDGLKLSILVQTCSDLGTQEGDLRMYTSEECDAMNGNFNPPGECLKKEGGSYTYECGKLYKGKPVTTKAANSFFGSIASTKPAAITSGMDFIHPSTIMGTSETNIPEMMSAVTQKRGGRRGSKLTRKKHSKTKLSRRRK